MYILRVGTIRYVNTIISYINIVNILCVINIGCTLDKLLLCILLLNYYYYYYKFVFIIFDTIVCVQSVYVRIFDMYFFKKIFDRTCAHTGGDRMLVEQWRSSVAL